MREISANLKRVNLNLNDISELESLSIWLYTPHITEQLNIICAYMTFVLVIAFPRLLQQIFKKFYSDFDAKIQDALLIQGIKSKIE